MQDSSLKVTDEQSAAVQKTPHRVSLDQIETSIDEVEYVRSNVAPQLTLALVKFKNGYVQVGQSAPADPANFNEDLGKTFAYEDAIRKAWPLFGFALCDKLANKGD